MRPRAGSTLVEIVIALTLLGIALPPVGVALMVAGREARRGEARVRLAIALLNVVAEVGAPAPESCSGLTGSRQDGRVALSWEALGDGQVRTVRVRATVPDVGAATVSDSLEFRIRCES